ncbi:tyrosine-type recombinase/integrase [Mycoplasmopsis pulmonis]|uniref:tyrosine-type recombinase/integrase n=1 Tax=Mycoplasmopsis pulmonis TaxID=2107 RepID=UPI001004DFA9|nr:tyrosine-type recombinase/integrase [Mycoplasmopsis pulmonis]MDZ7293665.1 tyrosine-type recombinase/integrase [Mycoplasmopsis pulmonis]VEU68296.1 integrase/recombinase [Mycoplasmopsis pulmonis]
MIEKYCAFLEKRNLSKKYVDSSWRILSKKLDVENNSHRKIMKIIVDDSNGAHYQRMLLASYKGFLKFHKKYKKVEDLLFLKIKKIDIVYRPVLKNKRLLKLTQFEENDSERIKKTKILIRFLYQTGIRIGELNTLILVNKKLYVHGKGNKNRQILYLEETFNTFRNYYPDLRYPMSLKTLRIEIKKILGKEFSPHSLRRSFATHMMQSGADPKTIMLQLGHSSINTTFQYVNSSESYNRKIYLKHLNK